MFIRLKTVSVTAAFGAIVAGALVLMPHPGEAANDKNPNQDEKLKIQIGQQISPVPLNIGRKDADTVYLGSYIVNVAGCAECHTFPPYIGDPFSGGPIIVNAPAYMAGGRPFGPVISRNITPDASGQPAGMSYSEFVQALRNGTDFDHIHPLLQVMPWPRFRSMTDRDLRAIYEYLSAIPCREGDPGVNPNPPPRCAP